MGEEFQSPFGRLDCGVGIGELLSPSEHLCRQRGDHARVAEILHDDNIEDTAFLNLELVPDNCFLIQSLEICLGDIKALTADIAGSLHIDDLNHQGGSFDVAGDDNRSSQQHSHLYSGGGIHQSAQLKLCFLQDLIKRLSVDHLHMALPGQFGRDTLDEEITQRMDAVRIMERIYRDGTFRHLLPGYEFGDLREKPGFRRYLLRCTV